MGYVDMLSFYELLGLIQLVMLARRTLFPLMCVPMKLPTGGLVFGWSYRNSWMTG